MSADPPASGASPSLLAADDLRVDVAGVPACDGLSFEARGARALVLGTPRALFEAATGLAAVVRGTLRVRGLEPKDAVRRGVIAGAAQGVPIPPRWTPAEYIQWSARLGGAPAAGARRAADDAIARLGLGPLAGTPASRLVPHARRATIVAAAIATNAEIIALEDPVGGLPDEVATWLGGVLAEALADRTWIVFAPRMPLASALAQRADEAIVGGAYRIEAQGAPAELASSGRRFVTRLAGDATAVLAALAERGASVEAQGAQIVLDLGSAMRTGELIGMCDAAGVTVLELAPLARALT